MNGNGEQRSLVTNRDQIAAAMPALLAHEGVWTGTYRTIDLDGRTIDRHSSRVECLFPESGDHHYVQRNRFTWADGRRREVEFGGALQDDRLVWDTETFSGYAWCSRDGVVLLTLDRKDLPNTSFTEIIVIGAEGNNRARTWHWFRDGVLFERTLCDERRER